MIERGRSREGGGEAEGIKGQIPIKEADLIKMDYSRFKTLDGQCKLLGIIKE